MFKTQFDNEAGRWTVSQEPGHNGNGAVIVRLDGRLYAMFDDSPNNLGDGLALAIETGNSARRVAQIKHSGLRAVKSYERSLVELAESGPALSRSFPRPARPGRTLTRQGQGFPLEHSDRHMIGIGRHRFVSSGD